MLRSFKIILFFSLLFFVAIPSFVFADVGENSANTVSLEDPLGMDNPEEGPQIFIGRIIDASLGVVGSRPC